MVTVDAIRGMGQSPVHVGKSVKSNLYDMLFNVPSLSEF